MPTPDDNNNKNTKARLEAAICTAKEISVICYYGGRAGGVGGGAVEERWEVMKSDKKLTWILW